MERHEGRRGGQPRGGGGKQLVAKDRGRTFAFHFARLRRDGVDLLLIFPLASSSSTYLLLLSLLLFLSLTSPLLFFHPLPLPPHRPLPVSSACLSTPFCSYLFFPLSPHRPLPVSSSACLSNSFCSYLEPIVQASGCGKLNILGQCLVGDGADNAPICIQQRPGVGHALETAVN